MDVFDDPLRALLSVGVALTHPTVGTGQVTAVTNSRIRICFQKLFI